MSNQQSNQKTSTVPDTAQNYIDNWTDPDGEVHEIPTLSAIGVNTAPQYSSPVNAIATSTSYRGIAIFSPIVGVLVSEIGLENALALPLVLLCLFVAVIAATRRSVVQQTEASGVE
jgi:hypothetical protein